MDDLKTVVNRLRPTTGLWNGKAPNFRNFVTPEIHGFTDRTIYLYGGRAGGAFKPQVTSGQELAALPELMQTLGVADDETLWQSISRTPVREMVYGTADTRRLGAAAPIRALGNAPREAQAVIDRLDTAGVLTGGVGGLDALRGFLALVIGNMSALSATTQEGIKILLHLLPRLSLATLWRQVPEPTRREILANLPGFLDAMEGVVKPSIRNFLSLRYPSAPNVARSASGLDGPMLTTYVTQKVNGATRNVTLVTNALNSITRREWLVQLLVNQVDLLTPDKMLAYLTRGEQRQAAKDYGKTIAIFLRGYGDTTHVKKVEGEPVGGLAVLENRNIEPWAGNKAARAGLDVDQAKAFALGYFDWLTAIQEPKRARAERLKADASKARSLNFWG
jgi:hypothetical protein